MTKHFAKTLSGHMSHTTKSEILRIRPYSCNNKKLLARKAETFLTNSSYKAMESDRKQWTIWTDCCLFSVWQSTEKRYKLYLPTYINSVYFEKRFTQQSSGTLWVTFCLLLLDGSSTYFSVIERDNTYTCIIISRSNFLLKHREPQSCKQR